MEWQNKTQSLYILTSSGVNALPQKEDDGSSPGKTLRSTALFYLQLQALRAVYGNQ